MLVELLLWAAPLTPGVSAKVASLLPCWVADWVGVWGPVGRAVLKGTYLSFMTPDDGLPFTPGFSSCCPRWTNWTNRPPWLGCSLYQAITWRSADEVTCAKWLEQHFDYGNQSQMLVSGSCKTAPHVSLCLHTSWRGKFKRALRILSMAI